MNDNKTSIKRFNSFNDCHHRFFVIFCFVNNVNNIVVWKLQTENP